jgi:enoyl-CoA hydratase
LPRLIGTGAALELIFTGGKINAEEALRIGLVDKVFSPEQLMQEARKTAIRILEVGPVAVAFAKEAVRRGGQLPLADGLRIEADLFGMISATRDMREGLRAFLEKRKPEFKGE